MLGGNDAEQFIKKLSHAFPWMNVRFNGMVPSKLAPQVLAEQKNGVFAWDVHVGPTANMVRVLGPGGALDLIEPYLEGAPSIDADKWAGGFARFTDGSRKTTFVTYYRYGGGIFVNRRRSPVKSISSAIDLITPELKGRIVIYDPTALNGASMTLAVAYKQFGEDFIRKLLLEQQPVITNNPRDTGEWVSQGRYPVAFYMLEDDIKQLSEQGLLKDVEVLKNSRYVLTYGVSVFKNPPNPNVVKVFLNWFLSQAGQDAYSSITSLGGTRRNDVKVYAPEDIADPQKLDDYGYVGGVSAGQESVNKVIEIARSRL
jgi:ABC-type Fe3+ transport system substrate-binding protein